MADLIFQALCRRIIDNTVKWLPEHERDRFREEWQAHLDEIDSSLGKLNHALGCALSLRSLKIELSKQRAPRAAVIKTAPQTVTRSNKYKIAVSGKMVGRVILIVVMSTIGAILARYANFTTRSSYPNNLHALRMEMETAGSKETVPAVAEVCQSGGPNSDVDVKAWSARAIAREWRCPHGLPPERERP